MTSPNLNLYSSATIHELEQIAITQYAISGYELMTRAGTVTFDFIQNKYLI